MNNYERFNPAQYLSTAVENSDDKVLEMAYHFENIDTATLPESDDVADTVDQQLVDLDNMYRSMHEVEERLKSIAHEGIITPDNAKRIEQDFPGTIVNAPISIEARGESTIDLKASVENMKRIRLGLILGAIISTIALLIKWVARKVNKSSGANAGIKTGVETLTNLLAKTDVDIPALFKEGIDAKGGTDMARKVTICIRQILGDNVTPQQVDKVFGSNRVTFADLLANSDKRIRHQIKCEVLSTKDGKKIIDDDVKFITTCKNDFVRFITDCSNFSNDIPRWMTGLKEHGGVGRDGRPLTPEAPVNSINLNIIVAMSKILGIALNQPTKVSNVNNAHQLITLSKPSLNERVAKYRNDMGDESLSESAITHLNNPDPILSQLLTQREQLDKWRALVDANSNKLGGMSKRLSVIKSQLDEMPADTDAKVVEIEELASMVVSNFSSICRYLVAVDDFNNTTTSMLNRTAIGIKNLNSVIA